MIKSLKTNSFKFRLSIILIFLFGLSSVLLYHLFKLQIQKGVYYSAKAQSQYRLAGYLQPTRGNLYLTDKYNNKIPVALNKTYPVIFAVPKEVEDIEETTQILHKILGLSIQKIKTSLSKRNDLYELLVQKATFEQINQIRDVAIKGIYIDDEDFRFYPFERLAAQLVGFVGESLDGKKIGRYGLESYYETLLAGKSGEIIKNKIKPGETGDDLQLTIDRNIQSRAEEILSNLIETYKASGGTVIVQEPVTGKILTMANYPSFDPNNYSSFNLKNFLNPAVQGLYEPGSIFKVITMAAGIDAGKITPETTYYDNGSLTLNGRTIRNWDLKAHGKMTMTEVIEQSVNTGAAFAEKSLGHDNFYSYLVKFGFNDKTGINVPGEVIGDLRNLRSSFRDINFATASFGQGVSVTPIALINAIGAIANGGLLMRPYVTADNNPSVMKRVISKEAALKVTRMMVSAVSKAKIAAIPKYEVAGKTGTAQVPDFKHGGYTDNVINTYVGFAPAFDPKFIILLKLDKPEGAPLAGLTVVPAFRELAEFILNYYNVPPDHE